MFFSVPLFQNPLAVRCPLWSCHFCLPNAEQSALLSLVANGYRRQDTSKPHIEIPCCDIVQHQRFQVGL